LKWADEEMRWEQDEKVGRKVVRARKVAARMEKEGRG
jgi:hypothetical protein